MVLLTYLLVLLSNWRILTPDPLLFIFQLLELSKLSLPRRLSYKSVTSHILIDRFPPSFPLNHSSPSLKIWVHSKYITPCQGFETPVKSLTCFGFLGEVCILPIVGFESLLFFLSYFVRFCCILENCAITRCLLTGLNFIPYTLQIDFYNHRLYFNTQ